MGQCTDEDFVDKRREAGEGLTGAPGGLEGRAAAALRATAAGTATASIASRRKLESSASTSSTCARAQNVAYHGI